jgi:peptidoglycan/LPS O-acetylase OafA/YrhL
MGIAKKPAVAQERCLPVAVSPTNPLRRRNPALDVVRAVAIILVINCHATSDFSPGSALGPVLSLGGIGVQLFFVLSGWLLGQQLCKEMVHTGTIQVRRFWYRRWLRTLPAYYAVLFFTYCWQIVLKHNWDLDFSFLYFGQNYRATMPYFGVSWSLCVEEHFYLLIAPLFLLLFRGRMLYCGLTGMLLLPSMFRYFHWYTNVKETHVSYDPCIVGVLLASISVASPRVWAFLVRIAPWASLLGMAALILNVLLRLGIGPLASDWKPLALGIIFGTFVLFAASNRWLESMHSLPGARYIADRAYALYLLHVEALVVVKRFAPHFFIVQLILTWAISLLLAEALFRLIERPIMDRREKYRATRSREAPIV